MESKKEAELIDKLLKNNIVLQSKLVDLLDSLKDLNKELKRIADVFEAAGGMVKEEQGKTESSVDQRIENLANQNKAIANTLMALEDFLKRPPQMPHIQQRLQPRPLPRPLPRRPI